MAFRSDDGQGQNVGSSRTDLTKTIEIDGNANNTTMSLDKTRKSKNLITTITNTMRLGIEEMEKTFAGSLKVRDDFDPNASQRISMSLVTFAKTIAEKRKPTT